MFFMKILSILLKFHEKTLSCPGDIKISCPGRRMFRYTFPPSMDAVSSEEGQLMKCDNLKRKLYPTLPGWPTCTYSYGKFSFHLGGIPAKSSEVPLRWASSLLI